jgi:hypothetical protein
MTIHNYKSQICLTDYRKTTMPVSITKKSINSSDRGILFISEKFARIIKVLDGLLNFQTKPFDGLCIEKVQITSNKKANLRGC